MADMNYVSVTGGISEEEVKGIIKEFREAGYTMDSSHAPAIGFLVSEKTLNGLPTPNKRFAKFEDIPLLVKAACEDVLPVIHYNSRNLETLSEQVKKAFGGIYKLCRTVQLNTEWPDPFEVYRIKEYLDELSIILQVSYKAMEGRGVKEIADKVIGYGDSIDYVLIDPSKGRGVSFDVSHSVSLYKEIKSKKDYSIVFAGGLCRENVLIVLAELLDRIGTTDFSVDAEGRLRDKHSDRFFGDDILNLEKVRKYLVNASKVLK